jgi:hypothetical protein
MKKIKTLLKEPLLLFFLFGIIAFMLYTQANAYIEKNNKQITISESQVALLQESFNKTWYRPPTQNELDAVIDGYVMDEIFFREAVAMGLDKSDPSVKRRLRQVMELMLEDYTTVYATEDQLRKYLSENPDKFRKEPRISFQHLYFPFENKAEAIDLLETLQKSESGEGEPMGHPLLIPPEFENESKRAIGNLFGNDFTTDIFEVESNTWNGPLESPYGWHLVHVSQFTKGELPDLNEIWDQVEIEWIAERKNEMKEEQYKIMKERYTISIGEL